MKYKQPQHHRSRGKATLPAPPQSTARSGGRCQRSQALQRYSAG